MNAEPVSTLAGLVVVFRYHPDIRQHTHDGPNTSPTFAGRNSPWTASANLGLARSGIDFTNNFTFGGSLKDAWYNMDRRLMSLNHKRKCEMDIQMPEGEVDIRPLSIGDEALQSVFINEPCVVPFGHTFVSREHAGS